MLVALLGCGTHSGAPERAAPSTMAAARDAEPPQVEASALPAGAQQYTLTMGSFEVPAGSEYYECQDVLNPFGKDIAIVKTESTVSLGAHHMYAFNIAPSISAFAPDASEPDGAPLGTPDGSTTSLFDCPQGGLEFHPYFHLTQRAHDETTYPQGVGRSLHATDVIRLMVHYLNAGSSAIQVGAEVTVTYVDPSAVSQLASWIFIYSQSLQVPTGLSVQSFSYSVTADMNMIQANGHMHRRGLNYEAYMTRGDAGDAEPPFYHSVTWDEPPSLSLSPAVVMKQGDNLVYSCAFDNETGGTLTYGESAATNEMCNFFGVFYPSADGSGLLMGL